MQQQRPITSFAQHGTASLFSRGPSGRASNRLAYITILSLALCMLVAAISRLVFLKHPWDGDTATFMCCGKAITQGARFGYDVCDNKFPTAALWDAFCWRILGSAWSHYVLAGCLAIAAMTAILATAAKKFAGQYAIVPTVLFALVYTNFCPALFGGFQLETSITLFSTAAAFFAIAGLATGRLTPTFLCGLISACGMYLKPTGLAPAAAFVAITLIQFFMRSSFSRGPTGRASELSPCQSPSTRKSTIAQLLALSVGLAIPLAAAFAYMYITDVLNILPHIYHQITGYAQNSVWDIYTTLKIAIALLALATPMWLRHRFGRRSIAASASKRASDAAANSSPAPSHLVTLSCCHLVSIFSLAWLLIELTGVIAQRRMYGYHFLVLAAPAALFFGQIPARPRLATMLLPIAPAIFFSLWGVMFQFFQRYDAPVLPVSQYLLAHADPTDTIWMDNMPRLLMETQLRPASRHLITMPFYNTDTSPQQMGAELLSDLARHPPTYIILPTQSHHMLDEQCAFMAELADRPLRRKNYCAVWEQIFNFVDNNYEPRAVIGDRTIYVLRTGSVEVTAAN